MRLSSRIDCARFRRFQLGKGKIAMHERQIVYRGRCDRSADRCIITVYRSLRIGGTRIYELPARNDVMNHSPDGFSWGYQGSGPAQAALAILLDFTDGDVARVQPIYQFFKDV